MVNLYMVKKDKYIYSILAENEEQALNLNGEIKDRIYTGMDESPSCEFRWEDWY